MPADKTITMHVTVDTKRLMEATLKRLALDPLASVEQIARDLLKENPTLYMWAGTSAYGILEAELLDIEH